MRALVSACLMLASLTVLAQEKLPPRVVRVIGTAEVRVIPDQVVVEVGVVKQGLTAKAAKKEADLAASSVIAAIRGTGIEHKDIQTTDLSLQPHYDYKSGRKLSHFSAEQSFTVTLREIKKLDSLLDVVIQAGANEIDSVEYKTNDLRKYRDQARSEAIKAAQEKAADLAKAVGQGIGKAYSIEEVPDYNYQWGSGVTANAFVPSHGSSSGESTTPPGERVVKASVTVSFDLI